MMAWTMADYQRLPWFALRVKSRCEKLVHSTLSGKGYSTLLPVYRVKRKWGGRDFKVELPLFPGYTFAAFDPEKRLPVLTTPGLMHLVGIGKAPYPLDEAEVDNIRRVVESDLDAQPWPFLQAGQQVEIHDGPLRGVSGLLLQIKRKQQLVVSVTLLQRAVAVEIQTDWVRPVAGASVR